ncbi:hypothetical protein L5515_002084 [Caenorhabditis briggsae]|uniref:Uncharacterized protein n=1 Tax=Caenorhabditis briggsae TaxID=6238 RepID=A0AAE9J4E9_CAEBR|nr:hypothetical protein L5515_002084 [Caenorhabditis briggsae]
MFKIQLILCLVFSPLLSAFPYGTQSFHITGRLICRGKPAQFVELQLINSRGYGEDNVEISDIVFSDPAGYFEVSGKMHQFYLIPAQIFIYHECFYDVGVHHGKCKSLRYEEVPKEFITEGPIPRITYEAGTINLEHGVFKEYLERCE